MRSRCSHKLRLYLSLVIVLSCNSIPQVLNARIREPELRPPSEYSVDISVLSLFHPRELIVSVPTGHALLLQADGQSMILESSQVSSASVRLDGSDLVVTSGKRQWHAAGMTVTGRGTSADEFIVEIPGKITRRYYGTLKIMPSSGNLAAVVTLDLEIAVASVVAAESAPDTPIEALKAYAVAARSYFVAGRGRHKGFDFCDTTHCQFLRAAPAPESFASHAVEATQGLVVTYKSRPFAAMYTRSCSGRTRTPAEVRMPSVDYPYYTVVCEHCRQHPVRWTSWLKAADAASLRPDDEGARLAVAKGLGWSAVPSNEFSLTKKGDHLLLTGIGNGHGIGLCQEGAKAMAESGADFREILEHYYPNTDIVQYSGRTPLD